MQLTSNSTVSEMNHANSSFNSRLSYNGWYLDGQGIYTIAITFNFHGDFASNLHPTSIIAKVSALTNGSVNSNVNINNETPYTPQEYADMANNVTAPKGLLSGGGSLSLIFKAINHTLSDSSGRYEFGFGPINL